MKNQLKIIIKNHNRTTTNYDTGYSNTRRGINFNNESAKSFFIETIKH